MGSNDSLVGLGITTEEDHRAEASGGRSEGSKRQRPFRGAPPSSLSQPILSDRSQSSSPSKPNRAPCNSTLPKSPASTKPKPLPVPSTPRLLKSDKKPLANYYRARNDLRAEASSRRGKTPVGGRAAFKHHRFLPRTISKSTPLSSSFEPLFPSPETHYAPNSYRAFEFKTPAPISPTTDISVKGEILPSSSTSHQLSVSSTPTIESTTAEDNTLDMSSTMETTSTQTFCPDTGNGYQGSPMARLMSQYKESSDEDISTFQRATNLSSKKSLLKSDIVELRGVQKSYALHSSLLENVTQVVSKLQVFLERTSALIPERSSYFKVDPRDTFLSILRESSDVGQLHAAWMGLTQRLSLAQENLVKYETQYRSPLAGENIIMPTSPVSTDVGIYEAIEDLDDLDLRLRYLYDNVPHHQDQIKSPRKLRDGASWGNILSLSSNLLDYDQNKLPTIVENVPEELDPREISQVKKGKRRITDEFASPPTSPRVLNVGFGTPFKSSSQFFTRPGGIPLPSAGTMSQQNVLVGLGLPHTPVFEDIPNPRNAHQSQRGNPQI